MAAIDVILAALAAGAGAGLSDTASAAVQDAYRELKGLIGNRFGDNTDVDRVLDVNEEDPQLWRGSVAALTDAGVDQDERVVQAAQRLLDLAGRGTNRAFNVQAQTVNGAIGDFSGPVTFNQGQALPPPLPEGR